MPSKPGVYQFLDENNTVIYIGKAVNLKSRVSSYFTGQLHLGEKTKAMVSQIKKIKVTEVESEIEALLLEAHYIKKYNPKYNIRLTDNKAYVLVRITNAKSIINRKNTKSEYRNSKQKTNDINTKNLKDSDFENLENVSNFGFRNSNLISQREQDAYSRVLLARRADDPNSIYFGPFPSSSTVKTVLKTIRRVFPYQAVQNHPKKICLYHHLGVCPCPPVFDSPELRKKYKKNIKNIIRIFEGESKKILAEFEKNRNTLSKEEKFEEAAEIQRKINALLYIMQPIRNPREYEINPNLRADLRSIELKNLEKILQTNGCPVENLERIECYDISHIQGSNTTASMVVFTNGEKDSSQYRKFRVRKKWLKKEVQTSEDLRGTQSNDFASMKEVLQRRLKHDEWHIPGLIIVDGGKGQVSSAVTILKELGYSIPLIGLAKREETIVIPQIQNLEFKIQNFLNGEQQEKKEHIKSSLIDLGNFKFHEISLPKDSGALQLIQRIRDEAHRFAITYHRKLRSKSVLK